MTCLAHSEEEICKNLKKNVLKTLPVLLHFEFDFQRQLEFLLKAARILKNYCLEELFVLFRKLKILI